MQPSEHPEQIESLYTYLQNQAGHTGILLGDFNMYPHNPLLSALRSLFDDPLFEQNLTLGTIKGKKSPKQLDRIFLSPDLQFVQASAPAVGPSDHYPVRMEITRRSDSPKKTLAFHLNDRKESVFSR